jgi:uncharacterized protein
MSSADFARAKHYALSRLERELAPTLTYHSVAHTRDDVVPAVERLALLELVGAHDTMLLRTAAWFHDLGFIECREGHEQVGARWAAEALPGFGYSEAEVATIVRLILATQMPQAPQDHLARIIADADLDLLGRQDFARGNLLLRDELARVGSTMSDVEWYRDQIAFLSSHRYWTASARALREPRKQKNLAQLVALLRRAEANSHNGQPPA